MPALVQLLKPTRWLYKIDRFRYGEAVPTIVRDGKFKVAIYTNDHLPAHVHVIFDDCVVRVVIAAASVTQGPTDGSPKRPDVSRALAIVADNLDLCLARWKEYHG